MMKAVSLLCEMLSILIILHNFMQKKFMKKPGTILFLVYDILGFLLIDKGIIPYYSQIVIYFGFVLYLWYEFRGEKTLKVIGGTVLSVFIVSGLQIAGFFLLFMISNQRLRSNLVNIIVFVIVCLIVHFGGLQKIYKFISVANQRIWFVVDLSAVVFILSLILVRILPDFTFFNALLIYTIFLLVLVFGQQWRSERERALSKERELRVLEHCKDSFEQLIIDVRARQHEFDNQFDAICGLRFSCTTFEEMKEKLNGALDYVYEENRFNKLLTMPCSPLIKGFLYGNFCKAADNNIKIDYQIELPADYPLTVEFDVQEIIGILFDNACEAMQNIEEPALSVSLSQEDNKLLIQVQNKSSYITQQEVQKFFKLKYSSKGSQRGYGLNNVKQIVKKYDGEIAAGNIEKQGENWFYIMVSLANLDG